MSHWQDNPENSGHASGTMSMASQGMPQDTYEEARRSSRGEGSLAFAVQAIKQISDGEWMNG